MNRQWGKKITDKNMINYMGRAIYFIQYMLLKPTQNGVKYFCVICTYTLALIGFEIYVRGE